MSLQTQAILPGHLTAAEIAVRLEEASAMLVLGYRTMRIPEHVLFELEEPNGEILCIEAFLHSWAVEDYAAITKGNSILLTTEHSQRAVDAFRQITTGGGWMREHELGSWTESQQMVAVRGV
ncbi:hypothetical protein [Sandaracinobacter sp.]|uniref:hypothetical protein n=1 Tax=Sandaracinobacter sp. TaxID=2487581 RepID=UPI0035B0A0D1